MKLCFPCAGLGAALLLCSALAQPVKADENFSYYPSSTLDKRGMRALSYSLGAYEFKSGVTHYRLTGQVITSAYIQFLCQKATLERNPGFKVIRSTEVTLWLDDATSLLLTLEGLNTFGNRVQTYTNCFARIEGQDLLFKARPL